MAITRSEPRLPGVCFLAKELPSDETLPRMDIGVFVGFAAKGELHMPIAVESVEEFRTAFGDDLSLAWDAKRGEPVYAYLAQAVDEPPFRGFADVYEPGGITIRNSAVIDTVPV